MQTVKEIVQSLVDDRLVSCEKIGTSNYYWSFPSSAAITRTTLIDKLEKENASLKHACERLEAEIQESSKGKDLTPEREELMQRLLELKEESKGLDRQLEEHADRDPAVIEALKKQVALAQQDCNRWVGMLLSLVRIACWWTSLLFILFLLFSLFVDNIFSVQSYVVDKFGLGKGEFLENFDLPADLDYVQ